MTRVEIVRVKRVIDSACENCACPWREHGSGGLCPLRAYNPEDFAALKYWKAPDA